MHQLEVMGGKHDGMVIDLDESPHRFIAIKYDGDQLWYVYCLSQHPRMPERAALVFEGTRTHLETA